MNLEMFSMYDEKAKAFIRPFFMPNLAMAQRSIVSAGEETNHPFSKHPQDYVLYGLGKWDEEHAEFEIYSPPERHGSIRQLTPKPEETGETNE